jgi:hypothetical protein
MRSSCLLSATVKTLFHRVLGQAHVDTAYLIPGVACVWDSGKLPLPSLFYESIDNSHRSYEPKRALSYHSYLQVMLDLDKEMTNSVFFSFLC